MLKNLINEDKLPIPRSETLCSKLTSERALTDPERLFCWHNSTAPKLFCCKERRFFKTESLKNFAIFTDHVLVQMEMETTDVQNSDTEGNTQKPHGNLLENLNAM